MQRRDFLKLAGAAALAPQLGRAMTASAADLSEDMWVLREALKLHPGLYRYNSPAGIAAALDRLEPRFMAARDQAERFLLLQRFLSMIRCGHTQCNFYNQSDAVVDALFERRTRLPFRFAWIDRQMVVLGDESGTGQLVRGSCVLGINGIPAQVYLDALLPYTRADGHNDGKRVAQLEMRNTDTFEYFDIYQGLVLPPPGDTHRIELLLPGGEQRVLDLPALGMAERQAGRTTLETDGTSEPFWTWEVRDGVAVLTMPTWTMYNSKWDWESWLDERLASLPGLRGMVMDLRDNEGGNECGNVILSRLTDRDLQFPGYQKRVVYRETPEALNPYLDTWDRSFRSIGVDARDSGEGYFVLPGETEETDFIPAATPRITVPVAALVGPACSSATFSFARRAKDSGLVRLFGETTGGNLRGINGGAYFFVRLPASGIEFDVPLIGYFPPGERPDAGVEPDVAVPRSVAEIAGGTDSCLASALAWIRNR